MSAEPNTGTPSLYEDGDQRNYSRKAIHEEQRTSLHNLEGYLPKDQHKAMNEMLTEKTQIQIEERHKNDPLYRATLHGNEPSRGARKDAEIMAEEAEIIKKKQEKTDSLPGKH